LQETETSLIGAAQVSVGTPSKNWRYSISY